MTFEEYLVKKKINAEAFKTAEPARWQQWKAEFEQLHPDSFTNNYKFLINPVRRKYRL